MGSDFIARHKKRLIICTALFLLSLFVVGSGNATTNYLEREAKAGAEKQAWQGVATTIGAELPIERAADWAHLSRGTPRVFMEANTRGLTAVTPIVETAELSGGKGSFGRLLLCMFEAQHGTIKN